jgi:hypothetical protein
VEEEEDDRDGNAFDPFDRATAPGAARPPESSLPSAARHGEVDHERTVPL